MNQSVTLPRLVDGEKADICVHFLSIGTQGESWVPQYPYKFRVNIHTLNICCSRQDPSKTQYFFRRKHLKVMVLFLSSLRRKPPPISWSSQWLAACFRSFCFHPEWHLCHSHGSNILTTNKSRLLSELFLSLLLQTTALIYNQGTHKRGSGVTGVDWPCVCT